MLASGLAKKFEKLLILNKKDLNDNNLNLKEVNDPGIIANNIAANLNLSLFEKQEILEIKDLRKRLEKLNHLVEKETSVISVEKRIRGRVKNQMEKHKESTI